MKITVIGTLNKDLILSFGGTPIESYGGIFYNISVLSYLLNETDEIYPVSYIGEDVQVPINAVLQKMPNIIPKGLIPIQQKNHRVILEYISPYSRKEKAVFNFPPLKWQKVSKFLDSDIIILNMISGWDINKNTYLKLCERVRKKLYLDVHFLVMGVDKLGKRFPQRPDNIRDWLRGARYIQMNHREFEIITDKSLSEKEFFQEYFISDQVLIITKGRNGATAVYKEHGQIKTEDVPAPQLKTLVDTTGCGDAFGSGFVYGLLKKLHLKDALKFANCVAAANALLRGTNEMHRLKETMKNLQCGEVD